MKKLSVYFSVFALIAQSLNLFSGTASTLQLTKNNILAGIPQSAETTASTFSFVYSNKGVLTKRTLFVTVPQGFTAATNSTTYPVCFAFHGTAKDGTGAARKCAQSGVNSGCVMIAPVGGKTTDGMFSWNANGSTTEDDLAFVRAVWAVISTDTRLAKSRVYAYGHSVGGLLVSNVLATKASFFAGLCAFSSQLMQSTSLTGVRVPVNMIYFHGLDDTMIPANGGAASFDTTLLFKSISDSVATWAIHNGYSGNITVESTDAYTKYSPIEQVNRASGRYSATDVQSGVTAAYVFNGVGHNSVQPVEEHFGVSAAKLMLELFE